MESSFWVEVIQPGGTTPVPEGTAGELVLTTLHRPGSPLVRYRTGDLVRARRISSTGTCERAASALTLEGGILGRVDDMIVIRGVNLYPSALEEWIRKSPDIGEFRITHDLRTALPELSIEIEASEATAQALAAKLQQHLALRIPVHPVAAGSLPRFELKARRWQRISPGTH